MKPNLKNVTLLAVDTTSKAHLAERAILKSLEQCDVGAAKLLTNNPSLKFSTPIPQLEGLEAYSNFCIREMHKHVDTTHALLIQSDGYVLNGAAWVDDFLHFDYIGSPWLPSGVVGNGGFSLRSKRLMELLSKTNFGDSPHPEDNYICIRHRAELEKLGMKFAPPEAAKRFSFEGRSWNNGVEWSGVPYSWNGSFGFHSWLTPLPKEIEKPLIFHHTGDWGDVIYSLPVIKAMGGGVLFLSDDNKFPFPRKSRERVTAEWVNNIKPLLEQQDYIWRAQFTHGTPFSTDFDLNQFRRRWQFPITDPGLSIFNQHQQEFNTHWPEDQPWLTVDKPFIVPGRPIIVNLTPRYRNHHFPWLHLIHEYADRMAFVGTKDEASRFESLCYGQGREVPWIPTADFMEAARVIAGGSVFLGNQSALMAIAMGLGNPVIQECWQSNPNCLFRRPKNIYWGVTTTDPEVEIPKEWLA
jgi:hypothetical protein